MLLLPVAQLEVRAQYLWKITHNDHDKNFRYSFTSVSCQGNQCTAAGLKIGDDSYHIKIIFFRSTDGGQSWLEQDPGLPYQLGQNQNYISQLQQIDSLNVVGIGDSGLIVRTFNGGASWITQFCGAKSGLTGIHFSDPNTGITFAPDSFATFTTIDGGMNWKKAPFKRDFLYQGHSYGNNTFKVFRYGHGPIYSTTNNWEAVDSTMEIFNNISDPSYRYVLGQANFDNGTNIISYGTYWDSLRGPLCFMMRSTNNGVSWEEPFIAPSFFSQMLDALSPIDRDTILAGGLQSIHKILMSIDRGKSWRTDSVVIDPAYDVNSIQGLAMTGDGHPIAIFSNLPIPTYVSILARGEISPSSVDIYERIINTTRISPNPASSYLSISSSEILKPIYIFDVLGREVIHSSIPESGKLTVNISSLSYGVYYIQLDHFGKRLPIGKFAVSH